MSEACLHQKQLRELLCAPPPSSYFTPTEVCLSCRWETTQKPCCTHSASGRCRSKAQPHTDQATLGMAPTPFLEDRQEHSQAASQGVKPPFWANFLFLRV